MSNAVENFLNDTAPTKTVKNSKNNEIQAIKDRLNNIVASLESIDTERELIKDVLKELKESHGIHPKVSRAVAKIMKSPEKLAEMQVQQEGVELLYDRLKA